MQNTLERLFAGIVEALREDVLPAVDDSYARSQLLAAIELLANIAERVEWRCDYLVEEIRAVRVLLGTDHEPLPEDNAALVATRIAELASLAQKQQEGLDTRALRAFLGERLERESAMLRTGMYTAL